MSIFADHTVSFSIAAYFKTLISVSLFCLADCGPLSDPADGLVTVTLTTYDEMANYTCGAGYDLIGVKTRTCWQDGNWSDAEPSCQRKGWISGFIYLFIYICFAKQV